jgi:hypothetical protein
MFSVADDVNRYIAEWLLRLKPPLVMAKQSDNEVEKTSVSALPSVVEKSSSMSSSSKAAMEVEGLDTFEQTSSFSDSTQPRDKVSVAGKEIANCDVFPTATELPDFVQHASANANVNGKNDFDPYVFTSEDVAILYGILDPLNEGSVCVEYFRQGKFMKKPNFDQKISKLKKSLSLQSTQSNSSLRRANFKFQKSLQSAQSTLSSF